MSSWYAPLCEGPIQHAPGDFSTCFRATTLAAVSPVILFACFFGSGGIHITKQYFAGVRLELGGVGVHRVKLGLAFAWVLVEGVALSQSILHPHDSGIWFAALNVIAALAAYFTALVSHPILPHSSTPLLFYLLAEIIVQLFNLNSTINHPSNLIWISLPILGLFFSLECLGPDGFGAGKIALSDDEAAPPDQIENEWHQLPCPRIRANIFSRLTFGWLTPMMKEGYHHYLTEEDLWSLPPEDTSHELSERLNNAWCRRSQKMKRDNYEGSKKNALLFAIFEAYGGPFFTAAFFKLLQDTLAFLQPQLLKHLLLFVGTYQTSHPESASNGYAIALLMFLCAVAQTIFLHIYFARVFETGMRVRTGLIALIYRKSLLLSNSERAGRLTGDIVNLQSTDATRLQDFCTYGQIIWSGLYQIILAFISLYSLLGWTMFVGVGVMILSIPLTALMARWQTRLQRQQMKNKDTRTSIMSEILSNIRSIKLYAWEKPFTEKLFNIRNNHELALLRKMGLIQSGTQFLWAFSPFLVAFASFACFSLISGKKLTSEIVFPSITLFSMLSFPLAILPAVFTSLVESYISIERISDFLGGKDLQEDAVEIITPTEELKNGEELIWIKKGDFCWGDPAAGSLTLTEIDLTVKKGELVAVVGRVGSGKSSLLSAILGEMIRVDGSVTVKGSIAYASQTPWIMGGTIRSNIIFGHAFDQAFYDVVLSACALRDDIAILPSGDMTEVGEKGISLSGGQKARIALARAVYARADSYLLDDVLSAVDAHVGRHLFDRVIGPNGLLAGKAVLFCTNAIPYCEQASEVVFLRRGVILERGAPDSLVHGETELSKLLAEYGKNSGTPSGSASEDETLLAEEEPELVEKLESASPLTKEAIKMAQEKSIIVDPATAKRNTLRELKASTRPKEARATGAVQKDVYSTYLQANGYLGSAGYVLAIATQQLFQVGTNVWLKNWSQSNADRDDNGDLAYYLGGYALLGFCSSFLMLVSGAILYSFCVIRAARTMHDGMFYSVIRSPMRFFETTPLGTILNRFSRDIYVIDEVLARVFGGFVRTLTAVMAMVVVISVSTPSFLLVFTPLIFVYMTVQKYYLATSRELKRLDATTKSPIFASFQETLGGLPTIRAYRQTKRFIAENEAHLDRNQEAFFPSINCNRWLAVRLEFLGSIIIFATASLAVFTLVKNGTIDAGMVGLMLSYALTTTQSLNFIVRSATEVETNIVSVERVHEYISLPSEAPYEVPDHEPAKDWPENGEVSYSQIYARYRKDLDPVLKNVNFHLGGGKKVGVCGRTGAGKSTLTLLLYRIIEAECGSVLIDGVDISKIGLHTLRSRLSIIPQDSQCFEGTLRENMDPTGQSTDQELWKALEQSRLKPFVESLDGKLDARIEEGGSNLSAGQRQLMCLGRALLRRSKILVLDEATAAVDPESDKEIQQIIRKEFSKCTIIIIAHRLNTILDCDYIMAMDQGQVAEFASPVELLSDKKSIFYSLAQEAGLTKGRSGFNTPSGFLTPRSERD